MLINFVTLCGHFGSLDQASITERMEIPRMLQIKFCQYTIKAKNPCNSESVIAKDTKLTFELPVMNYPSSFW